MSKEGRTDGDQNRPYGRDEVREALITAANELFGAKGPDAVSVRDVAGVARVNHALVHRHFGSKEQLVREVMKEHARRFAEIAGRSEDLSDALGLVFDLAEASPAFGRIVAHLMLNEHSPGDFVAENGGLAKLRDLAKETADCSRVDAQLRAASALAFSLGWLLFEPFVLHGVDYDGDLQVARGRVRELVQNLAAE